MLFFPDCSSVIRGAPRLVVGAPRLVVGAPTWFQTYHHHSHGTPVPVIRDPSYSEGRPECPHRVWYTPEIDAFNFTHHILSDTPGGSQRLKYILVMHATKEFVPGRCYRGHSLHFVCIGLRCHELQALSLRWHWYILPCNQVPDAQEMQGSQSIDGNTKAHSGGQYISCGWVHSDHIRARAH